MRLQDVLLHLDWLFRPAHTGDAVGAAVLPAPVAAPEAAGDTTEAVADAPEIPAYDASSSGRLSLLLQRIATDSNAIIDASPEALAAALRFISRRSPDPAGEAVERSRRVCNAILIARLNMLIDFPSKVYVSYSGEPGVLPRVWVRVGPHPARVRLPVASGELVQRVRCGDVDRSAVRALAYALGVNPPLVLNEFREVVGGGEPSADSAFLKLERCSLEVVRTVTGMSMAEQYAVFTIAKAQRPTGSRLPASVQVGAA